METETLFKLVTRRYLAWCIGGLFTITASFLTIWGAVTATFELVTAGIGIIGTGLGTIIGFYFGRKVSEE
jgi:hypothetical protein